MSKVESAKTVDQEENQTPETPETSNNQAQLPTVQETTTELQESPATDLQQTQDNAISLSTDENISEGDIQYSRLAICQPQSPEIAGSTPGYEAGMILDNMLREILSDHGPPPWMQGKVEDLSKLEKVHYLQFAPVFQLPHEYIHWRDLNIEGRGWHWKSFDHTEQRVREGIFPPKGIWRPAKDSLDKSPPVTDNINFLIIPIDSDGTPKASYIVATFSRSSFNTGRKLATACNTHKLGGMQYWQKTYYLYTKREYNEVKKAYYYTLNLAKGVRLNKVDSDNLIDATCRQMALELSDRTPLPEDERESGIFTKGQKAQRVIISGAFLEESADNPTQEGGDDPEF